MSDTVDVKVGGDVGGASSDAVDSGVAVGLGLHLRVGLA